MADVTYKWYKDSIEVQDSADSCYVVSDFTAKYYVEIYVDGELVHTLPTVDIIAPLPSGSSVVLGS